MQYEKRTFTRVFYSHMFGPVPQSLCNIYLSATGPAVRGGDLHPGVLHVWSRASVPLKHSSFSAWTCRTRRGPSPGGSTCLVVFAPSSTAPSTSPSTPWAGWSSSGPSSRYTVTRGLSWYLASIGCPMSKQASSHQGRLEILG